MDIEDLKYILQQHAYIVGQSVLATALLEGMKAENERAIQMSEFVIVLVLIVASIGLV